jgi:hypothetical protein
MSERVSRFLISLSQDPDKLDRFQSDPDSVLADSDLTPEEKAMVRSGDEGAIRESLGPAGDSAPMTSSTQNSPSKRPHNPPGGNPGNRNPGGGDKGNP